MKIKTLLRNSGLFTPSDHSSSGISSIKSTSSSNGELEKQNPETEDDKVDLDSDEDFDKLSWSNFKINIELVSKATIEPFYVIDKTIYTLNLAI